VNGYVSQAAAQSEYGVVIEYLGSSEQLVRLPKHYRVDLSATEKLRRKMQQSI